MPSRPAKLLRVRGLVQGVGFRYATLQRAQGLGLDGWVRNRRDRTVEILAAGEASALATLVDWVRAGGPQSAQVEDVDLTDTVCDVEGFSVEDTL